MSNNGSHSSSDPVALARLIHQARLEHQLSIRQLAAISKVAKTFIIRVENGSVEQPSAANLVRLARSLELYEAEVLSLGGVTLSPQTTSLDVMLRLSYDLPPEAIARIKQDIEKVIDEYNRP